MVKRASAGKATQASKMLVAGSYQFAVAAQTGMTLAAGTNLVQAYTASSEQMLKWYRLQYLFDLGSGGKYLTLAMVKMESGDSTPNVSDADTVEKLKRDGKLFFFKHVYMRPVNYGGSMHVEPEFKNVKLRVGESLKWIIYNHSTVATGLCNDMAVEEYRVLTV